MAIKIGDKAPSFKLYSSDKEEVSLEQFEGKNVVLLFFPMAFTSVCTEELCSVRDDIAAYNDLNAEVVAISVDSPFTLNKFREDQNLNFTLLSDFNKEVSQAYGSFHEVFALGMKGVSKRSAFVIDSNGVVKYAEVSDHPVNIPSFAAIKETLDRLN